MAATGGIPGRWGRFWLRFAIRQSWVRYGKTSAPVPLEEALSLLEGVCRSLTEAERQGRPCCALTERALYILSSRRRAVLLRDRDRLAPAPELDRGEAAGAATAVYQLAAVLYRALTGQAVPHDRGRDGGLDPAVLALERVGLTKGQLVAMVCALDPEPSGRPPTVEAFLDRLADGEEILPPLPPPPEKLGVISRRTAMIAAVLACLVAVGASVLGTWKHTLESAQAALDAGQYALAAQRIRAVPDQYSPQAELIRRMAEAGLCYEMGEYEQALAKARLLGDYGNAPLLARAALEKLMDRDYGQIMTQILRELSLGRNARAEQQLEEGLTLYSEPAWQQRLVLGYAEQAAGLVDPLELYLRIAALEDGEDVTLPAALEQQLETHGTDAFWSGDAWRARQCLKAADTGPARQLLAVMDSSDPRVLTEHMDSPIARERLHSTAVLERFLEGSWSGGGYRLTVTEAGEMETDLPWSVPDSAWYRMEGGRVLQQSDTGEVEAFSITVAARDRIRVEIAATGRTVTMTAEE